MVIVGDILDILLKDEQIHHAEEYDQLIIDYDKKNKVIEIEIFDASKGTLKYF
jgi:uncharacterized protein YuzE